MITKRDVHALQQKIAALHEALSAAEDLRRSEVASAMAQVAAMTERLRQMGATILEKDQERRYLAEQVDTYKAQAESRQRDMQRLDTEIETAARKLDEAKTREAILHDQIREMKATAKAEAEGARKDLRKARQELARGKEAAEQTVRAALARAREAESKLTAAKVEIKMLKAIKPEPAPAPEPEMRIVEKVVCEREPEDIAEIERLKKELAACRSGQAGA